MIELWASLDNACDRKVFVADVKPEDAFPEFKRRRDERPSDVQARWMAEHALLAQRQHQYIQDSAIMLLVEVSKQHTDSLIKRKLVFDTALTAMGEFWLAEKYLQVFRTRVITTDVHIEFSVTYAVTNPNKHHTLYVSAYSPSQRHDHV